MDVKDYLNIVSYISCSDISDDDGKVYYSNFDNSYIGRLGMENDIMFLSDREITEELTSGVGFSPKDNKWYGWSHRAIQGFCIGAICKKGDCHYVASTPEEMIDDYAEFFLDISIECAKEHRAECQILPDRSGIRILHTPLKLPIVDFDRIESELDNIDDLTVETIFEDAFSVNKCGRGEWVAETMYDAKQMAIDFNEGVS